MSAIDAMLRLVPPVLRQVGYRQRRSYYDGPLGKREMVWHEPVFVLVPPAQLAAELDA